MYDGTSGKRKSIRLRVSIEMRPISDAFVSAAFSSKGGKNIVDDPLPAWRQPNECLSAILGTLRDVHKPRALKCRTRAACTGLHQTETVPQLLQRYAIRARPDVEQETVRIDRERVSPSAFDLRIPKNLQCI
jgi:hypothetical protein